MSEYCENCRLAQKTINELEERVEEYYELNEKLLALVEELTAANNDAYSRGWVGALTEAQEWRNPTAVLEDE